MQNIQIIHPRALSKDVINLENVESFIRNEYPSDTQEKMFRYLFGSLGINKGYMGAYEYNKFIQAHDTKEITKPSHTEEIKVKVSHDITIISNETKENPDAPGKNFSNIVLLIKEDFCHPGDIYDTGAIEGDQTLHCSSKSSAGNAWRYVFRVAAGTEENFIDKKFLEPGKSLSKMATPVGDRAVRGGGTQGESKVSFTNKITRLKLNKVFTHAGLLAMRGRQKVPMAFNVGKQVYSGWVEHEKIALINEGYSQTLRFLHNSQISSKPYLDPVSGTEVDPGMGLYQQYFTRGDNHYLNKWNLKRIVDIVMAKFDGMKSYTQGKVIDMDMTPRGIHNFSKLVEASGLKYFRTVYNMTDMSLKNLSKEDIGDGHTFSFYRVAGGPILRAVPNIDPSLKGSNAEKSEITGNYKADEIIIIKDVTMGLDRSEFQGQYDTSKSNIRVLLYPGYNGISQEPSAIDFMGNRIRGASGLKEEIEISFSSAIGSIIKDHSKTIIIRPV